MARAAAGVQSPVAMLVFNRPAETARVLEAVRAARPRRLLVVADGPRQERPNEAERCAAVRALFDRLDWPCEVERDFSAVNLGCGRRVSTGIAWVFSRVEEAIFLEDDCLPDPTFFPYCDDLLARYRDDARIMAITGNNFQQGRVRGAGSYYFSRYVHIWGWATWRRAFACYDFEMEAWPTLRERRWLRELLDGRSAARYWTRAFDRTFSKEIDTWDYQWLLAIWANAGLVATPNCNLVTNIGSADGATHQSAASLLHLPTWPMALPLRAPLLVESDTEADSFVQRTVYSRSVAARAAALTMRLLRRARTWLARLPESG